MVCSQAMQERVYVCVSVCVRAVYDVYVCVVCMCAVWVVCAYGIHVCCVCIRVLCVCGVYGTCECCMCGMCVWYMCMLYVNMCVCCVWYM